MKSIIERKSERKKKALMKLVETGEYTIAFALMEAERLNDEGKLLDNDYEEIAEYLESLMEEVTEENVTEIEENEEDPVKETEVTE